MLESAPAYEIKKYLVFLPRYGYYGMAQHEMTKFPDGRCQQVVEILGLGHYWHCLSGNIRPAIWTFVGPVQHDGMYVDEISNK